MIGNWWEERELRDNTGEGRTITMRHIPKKHGDLQEVITHDFAFDNTKERIVGKSNDQIFDTHNLGYGRDKNPALSLRTTGKRTECLEQEIMKQVLSEKVERERKEAEMG